MNVIKYVIVVIAVFFINMQEANAQLRKIANFNVEKVKSFSAGSVTLVKSKITTDSVETIPIYSVTLKNNSRYHRDIVLYLGNEQEMLKNLRDFSEALKTGKKGDYFDFKSSEETYTLSYSKMLGAACFKVSNSLSAPSSDYGLFFKSTIDDILEYFDKNKK